jgi:hypothetical protein
VQFGDEQYARARAGLKAAIISGREVGSSPRLTAVMNFRDKHLAHSLAATDREAKRGVIGSMKYGDETDLLKASIPIIESLFCW